MAKKKAKETTTRAAAKKAPKRKAKTTAKKPLKSSAKKSVKSPTRKKPAAKARPTTRKAAAKAPTKKNPAAIKKVNRTPAPVVKEKPKPKVKKLPARELKFYKQLLQQLRDKVVDEITFLAGDNLNRSQRDSSGDLSSYSFHMADQGTDNFDREFALNLVSSEQDVLYEIDEALRRIELGTYGICEMTGEQIEKERLKAMPHTRYSLTAQTELEKGKARYRPFGPTIGQVAARPSAG